ncbi:MAG: UDP-N-acetylglucosamine 4,6-dehydratase [bacterium]|nr:UDP-N-acetylglucosamine 4,6-dehydratase [bacterium]
MDQTLEIIGRQGPGLFDRDIREQEAELRRLCGAGRFLVIGGAGSIGQAVVKEILLRGPRACHVVDVSENNLVELVRDVRSSMTDVAEDFRTLPISFASLEFRRFVDDQPAYDYVLNLAALKHVRSEKDPFSLMRMIDTNVLDPEALLEWADSIGPKKFFAVSTDKAANPVNLMGATKSLMELVLYRASRTLPVSTARFANVAFSDGSLLHGFRQRLIKRQPLSAPRDVRRYFVTFKEAGELCLASCMLGENRDIFFPKLDEDLHLITFSEIAVRFLERAGYEAVPFPTEAEAIEAVDHLEPQRKWPCHFFDSDTTGEKPFEEFFVPGEMLDMQRFHGIGVIRNPDLPDLSRIDEFKRKIAEIKSRPTWDKAEMVEIFREALPDLEHEEKGKNLDQKM